MNRSRTGASLLVALAAATAAGFVTLAAGDVASASSPGLNGRIAFRSDRGGNFDIYTMNSDGGDVVQLAGSPLVDGQPAWSPDGTRIVFQSNRSGTSQLYVMNADGSDETRLTNDTAADFQPAWSPDGDRIAFSSTRNGGDEDIFVMNADGTNPVPLTDNTAADSFPASAQANAR